MCLMITAVLPPSVVDDALRELLVAHGMSPVPLRNAHVLAQLLPGERYVSLTRAHCDCGCPLFTKPRRGGNVTRERDVRAKRAKGWSEAKIEKWLASRAPRSTSAVSRRDGAMGREEWRSFVGQALSLDGGDYVGLLGHEYRGSIVDEAVQLEGRRNASLHELSAPDERLALDELYVFHRS